MRILVTGGAGYVGSVVAAQPLAAGHQASPSGRAVGRPRDPGRRPGKLNAFEDGASEMSQMTTIGERASVWSAPGRANLMGEHTDYNQAWCSRSLSPKASP